MPRVLTVIPPPVKPEVEHLLRITTRWPLAWPGWDRFLIGWCAAFHLLTALTLAFAPWDQLLTEGTAPVFALASRYVWAALFAVAGAAAWSLLARRTAARQLLTWFTVMPLGGVWLTAFALAVTHGEGSAIGVVVWPFLYGPWVIAGIRCGLERQ